MSNKMKNILYKVQGFALCLLVAGLTVLTSCKDDDKVSTEVQLLSMGPSGVHHGDEISFIGQNLDQVTSIVFKPAVEVPRGSFAAQSGDKITVTVPAAAEAGTVILKTPSGDIVSKSILNFEVPVVISTVTAEAKPGTEITITGDKLNWIESITFASDLVVEKEGFSSQSMSQLVVTVPMEAQSGFLIFSTGGTDPLTFGTAEQLIVTLPTVDDLSPASIRHTNNLTITGTDLDLVTSVVFGGGASVAQASFVSQSETQIVVAVPASTVKGKLTLKQASPVDVITDDELTIILPIGTAISPTPAKPGVDVITITGTDLDLVETLKVPGAEIPKASFTTHTATQIKFDLPASAGQGAVDYVTVHGFAGPLGVILKLPPTGAFPVLDYYIYKDGLQSGWSAWGGWGHVSQDYNNTENPATGTKAIKTVFNDAYGALQIHNDGAANIFSGYNYLVFYVHTNVDSDIIAQIGNNGDFYPPHFTGNKYHQIVVPLAQLAGSNSVDELRIKNNNSNAPTSNTVVYIDEIGLTVDLPLGLLPDLSKVVYDDAAKSPFGMGGGWGGTATVNNSIEQQRQGDASIKATYVGGWGGAAQFGAWGNTPLSTAGTTAFAFSVYGGPGTDGKNIQVNIKPTTDGTSVSKQVAIEEGKWTDISIPLSDFGNPASIGEIQFQDTDWSGVIYIDHVGLK
jgi:hypothetical protein